MLQHDPPAAPDDSFGLECWSMHVLQKSELIRPELLKDVSHELRTLLMTLSTHLETLSLLRRDLSAREQRRYVAIALAQSRGLTKLVTQLLDLNQLEAGEACFAPEPLQLAELASDAAQQAKPTAHRVGVRLSIERPQPMPLVVGDIRLLVRLFENLLDNAVRHAGAGGEVLVRLSQQRLTVRVEVHDSGPAIAGSEDDRVLQRFCRRGNRGLVEAGHSGLSLAIVRDILRLHEQEIGFVCLPDRGTTFSFALPLLSSASGA